MNCKSVLISIRPNWCAKIANEEKTLEVRKNRPKIQTPFKCYIYCTKQKAKHALHTYVNESAFRNEYGITTRWRSGEDIVDVNSHLPECRHNNYLAEGKVIGEFVCDYMPYMQNPFTGEMYPEPLVASCLTQEEAYAYSSGKTLYGWHISELKIYGKPIELSEFGLSRPPQSWCYVNK